MCYILPNISNEQNITIFFGRQYLYFLWIITFILWNVSFSYLSLPICYRSMSLSASAWHSWGSTQWLCGNLIHRVWMISEWEVGEAGRQNAKVGKRELHLLCLPACLSAGAPEDGYATAEAAEMVCGRMALFGEAKGSLALRHRASPCLTGLAAGPGQISLISCSFLSS